MSSTQIIGGGVTLLRMIQKIGAQASLGICLDAGDRNCWNGSGNWNDVSGGGQHFNAGGSFNGSPGRCSANEYWGLNGSQYFSPTGAPNFAEAWHGLGPFTVLALCFTTSTAANIFSNQGTGAVSSLRGTFFNFSLLVTPRLFITLRKPNVVVMTAGTVTDSVPQNAWTFLASAGNGSNEAINQIDAVRVVQSPAYVTSGDGAASVGPYRIGANSGGTGLFANGSRLACFAAWNRYLSGSELDALYAQLKHRFKTLP
jgi:hypothetical protein